MRLDPRVPPAVPLRDRMVSVAVELTSTEGWVRVTMARLADEVGASRQTVCNEIGSKSALAEALVTSELEAFLGVVRDAFESHPEDLEATREGQRAAARGRLGDPWRRHRAAVV